MRKQRMTKRVRWGWHVTDKEGRLGYNDGRVVVGGEKMPALRNGKPAKGDLPRICEFGMHASPYPDQAIKQFTQAHKGSEPYWVWVVKVEGNLDYTGAPGTITKFCGMYRTAYARYTIHELLMRSSNEFLTARAMWDKLLKKAQPRNRR